MKFGAALGRRKILKKKADLERWHYCSHGEITAPQNQQHPLPSLSVLSVCCALAHWMCTSGKGRLEPSMPAHVLRLPIFLLDLPAARANSNIAPHNHQQVVPEFQLSFNFHSRPIWQLIAAAQIVNADLHLTFTRDSIVIPWPSFRPHSRWQLLPLRYYLKKQAECNCRTRNFGTLVELPSTSGPNESAKHFSPSCHRNWCLQRAELPI